MITIVIPTSLYAILANHLLSMKSIETSSFIDNQNALMLTIYFRLLNDGINLQVFIDSSTTIIQFYSGNYTLYTRITKYFGKMLSLFIKCDRLHFMKRMGQYNIKGNGNYCKKY